MVAERKLHRPLLPWQRYVADVALEIDPATGLLAYGVVGVTVPRQSGKTTGLLFAVLVARCAEWGERQMAVYTAQDGASATRKFENDFVEILAASTYVEGVDYTKRIGNNRPRILFTKTRSQLWPSPTESSSGHGDSLDMPALDEIWEHKTADVDQGFTPPMVTRPEPQKWLLSTAGDHRSVYLKNKREAGRAAVEADSGFDMAWFEWGADEEWDVTDRRLWWYYMPALGHTQTEKAMATQLADLKPEGFRRAFGNIDTELEEAEPGPISPEAWTAARIEPEEVGELERIVGGIDVSPDRTEASIGVAAARRDGGYLVELVDAREGTRWIPARVLEVAARQGIRSWAIDPRSPAGSLIPDLEALGITIEPAECRGRRCSHVGHIIKVSASDYARASGALVDRVPTGELFHIGQLELDDAVAGAKTKASSDAWYWDRKRPECNITPLVAVTLAFGVLLGEPAPASPYADRGGLFDWSTLDA